MKQLGLVLLLVLLALFLMDRSLNPSSSEDGVDVPSSAPWSNSPNTLPSGSPNSSRLPDSVCGFGCTQEESGYQWAGRGQAYSDNDCDMAGYQSASGEFSAGCKAYLHGEGPPSNDSTASGWNAEIH